MDITKKTLYEVLKPLEENLRVAYQQGGRISSGIFRDLEIYEEYRGMNIPKMQRYTFISEKFKISETLVRGIIKKMGKSFFLKKNLPL